MLGACVRNTNVLGGGLVWSGVTAHRYDFYDSGCDKTRHLELMREAALNGTLFLFMAAAFHPIFFVLSIWRISSHLLSALHACCCVPRDG